MSGTVITIGLGGKDTFQTRNEWMVDRSARVIAVYEGIPGGTKNTIEYAKRIGCEVISAIADNYM